MRVCFDDGAKKKLKLLIFIIFSKLWHKPIFRQQRSNPKMQLVFILQLINDFFVFTFIFQYFQFLENKKTGGSACMDVPGECDESRGLSCAGKKGQKVCS